MASSGTINGNQSGTQPYLRILWDIRSQDVSNNRSRVRLRLVLVSPFQLNFSTSKTGSNNGSSFTYSGGFSGTGTQIINTREIWVNHNSDGTRTQSVSGSFNIQVNWSGSQLNSISVSGSMNLDAIPRASDLTAFSIGSHLRPNTSNSVALTINRKHSSFTHDVQLRRGSTVFASWTGVETGGSLPLTADQVNTLLERSSDWVTMNVTLRVQTKSGSSNIGSAVSRDSMTTVHSSVVPTASNIRALISGSGRDDEINRYVQGITRVFSDFSTSTTGGATLAERHIMIRKDSDKSDSQRINGRSGTTRELRSAGLYEVIGSVTDSRGRTATVRRTFTVDAYSPPTISKFEVTRDENTPTTVRVNRRGNHTPISGTLNPLTILVERRESSGGSWTEVDSAISHSSSFGAIIPVSGNDVLVSYDYRVIIQDSFGNGLDASGTVSTQKVLLDIHKNEGIGIGKLHERGDLDVEGEAYFNGSMFFESGIVSRLNAINYSADSTPSQLPEGFSYFDSAFADGFPTSLGSVFNFMISGTRNLQLLSTHSGDLLKYRMFHNQGNNGWGDWREVAVYQRGSNSNGEWIRFHNGVQICWGNESLNRGSGVTGINGYWRSEFEPMTYPAAFSSSTDTPTCLFNIARSISDNNLVWHTTRLEGDLYSQTPAVASVRTFQTSSTAFRISYIAIGRWK